MSTLSGSITSLHNARTSLWNAKQKADGARSRATAELWSGAAGDVWRAETSVVNESVVPLRQALSDASTAISAYVSEVSTIQSETAREKEKLRNASAVYFHFSGLNLNPIDNATELVRKAVAFREMAEAEAAILALGGRRQSADDALLAAISRALPESWDETRAALASVGLTSASVLTKANVAEALADLAARIVDNYAGNADDREALSQLLTMYGDDEQVMSQFYQQLGGGDTVRLIDALGNEYGTNAHLDPDILELAQQVRAGLSVGSANWNDDMAQAYIASITGPDAGIFGIDLNAALGYLFAEPDTTPMGSQLSYQLAIEIDRIEREEQHPLWYNNSRADLGGNVLYYAEHPDRMDLMQDYSGNIPGHLDAAGNVFETLGLYSELSFEFLTDSGEGGHRIDYWFRQRDWSFPSEFEGPAGLWFGAAQIPGGPNANFPFDASTDGVGEMEALMTAAIIEALADNPTFNTELLSNGAAQDLGGAIALHLEAVGALYTGPDNPIPPGATLFEYADLVTGEARVGAVMDMGKFLRVLGQVGANVDGAITLTVATDVLAEKYLDAAGSELGEVNEALTRISTLDGFLDGASVGATLDEATRHDEALRERIAAVTDGISSLVGLIDLPYVAGVGVGAGTDFALGLWADHWFKTEHLYTQAALDAENTLEAQRIVSELKNSTAVYEILESQGQIPDGIGDPTALDPRDPEFISDASRWLGEFYALDEIDSYSEAIADWQAGYNMASEAGQ